MRVLMGVCLLVLPVISMAQPMQGMSEDQMQKMMQQAQKMQECMQNVDQSSLQELEQRSRKVTADIQTACAAGDRDEAMEIAKGFGKKMMSDPDILEMKKCSEMMAGMMQEMPNMPKAFDMDDYKDKHVCDQ